METPKIQYYLNIKQEVQNFHEISPSDSGRVLDTKVGTDEHTDERMDGFPYYYVSHDLHVVEKLLKICTSLI